MINEIIEKIKAWFGYNWKTYPLQIVGLGLLLIAFACGLLHFTWPAWGFLAAVGVIDLYLIFIVKTKTVSWVIQRLTGRIIDMIILFVLIPIVWWRCGEYAALFLMFGYLIYHFFGEE